MNPGDILDNRYQILERLGAGGMGEVFKATHLHLGATRVIKVIHSHISGNPDASERFIREARTSTKVHHQNVATMHDFSQLPDGSHYMVWEFIDGENLAQRLRSRGTLPPRFAIHLIVQALQGLEAIHRAGIVHRDISPENLMITTADDTIKIIDLGVAKVEDAAATSQTRTGMFVGKLRYASPEQLGFIPDGEKIDGRTDIYATAMVLVELLTGRPPYEAKSPHEYFMMHASNAGLKTVELPVELPGSAALQSVIGKALARNRNERYSTAREFAEALDEVARALPDSRNTATMALPLDGDATIRPSQRPMSNPGFTQPDSLHRATIVTGGGAATPPPPPPNSAATLLTPLPHTLPQPHAQVPPQATFQAPAPRQGSIVPLLIIGVIVLLAGVVAAGLLLWPLIKKQTSSSTVATQTATSTQTAAPSTVAESSVTVTSDDAEPPVPGTLATSTLDDTEPETDPETEEGTDGANSAPSGTTPAETTPPRPAPGAPPQKRPTTKPPETAPGVDDEEELAPAPSSYPSGTYVDGGDDEDANERALSNLRRQIEGTRRVALRAGAMQAEVTRALREFQPDLEITTNADVVIRFAGTAERRSRGLKLRAATATVEKNGRVIFRYQLPDELYRLGDTAPEAFARVFTQALEEE